MAKLRGFSSILFAVILRSELEHSMSMPMANDTCSKSALSYLGTIQGTLQTILSAFMAHEIQVKTDIRSLHIYCITDI